MRIIVSVKHVPETGAVVFDEETGTLKRDGVESIPNPLDLYAVEVALRLRDRYGGRITAISMGPAGAERSLREVIAMGCDDAVLLTGREFAGSDTLATSRALARAVEKLGGCDLLVFGERATDGDTGQVGPGTAALLDYPLAAYVSAVVGVEPAGAAKPAAASPPPPAPLPPGAHILVERLTEEGYERLALELPAALTVVKEAATPRLPTLRGKQRARAAEVRRFAGADLGLEPTQTGLEGSPTRVERIFHPKIAREGELLHATDERSLQAAAGRVADFLIAELPELGGGSAPARKRGLEKVGGVEAFSIAAAISASGRSGAAAVRRAGGPEVWVVAEDRGDRGAEVTWELITRARPLAEKLGGRLSVVVVGGRAEPAALEELFARGADRIYLAVDPSLDRFVVEPRRRLLERLVRERRPAAIIAAATTSGRSLMPQLAVRLGTGLTADCTELAIDPASGSLLQTRPAIGGNIMATIRTRNATPSMATVRPHSAPPAARSRARGHGEVVAVGLLPGEVEGRVRHLSLQPLPDATGALEDARVVVSCGRGFRKRENLALAAELAGLLGAAIGASREAVDRGWIGYPHQVGLSGKTISPELYLAIGISGAVQHLAGIKTAKSIVAINNDPEAPIFRIADFGVVGDLFALMPLLAAELRRRLRAGALQEAPR